MSNQIEQIEISNEPFCLQAFEKKLREKHEMKEVTHLRLYLNYHSSILKEVSGFHSDLSKLIFLNLGYNNIESLEPLLKFSFQHLEELHLFHNNIVSLRTLRRCSMPSLTYISVVNNRLNELTGISEWNCPNLKQFFAYDNPIESGAKSIIKMNCDGLKHIIINEETMERNQYAQYCYFIRFQGYSLF